MVRTTRGDKVQNEINELFWLVKLHGPQLGYVERFPADDKPGPGQPGRNLNFIQIYFWTGTRPPNSCFQAAHDTPSFKKSFFLKFI